MTEDEILSALKPCPFCGAGETKALISSSGSGDVNLTHYCSLVSGCLSQRVEIWGRGAPSAISQWNARAGETP